MDIYVQKRISVRTTLGQLKPGEAFIWVYPEQPHTNSPKMRVLADGDGKIRVLSRHPSHSGPCVSFISLANDHPDAVCKPGVVEYFLSSTEVIRLKQVGPLRFEEA